MNEELQNHSEDVKFAIELAYTLRNGNDLRKIYDIRVYTDYFEPDAHFGMITFIIFVEHDRIGHLKVRLVNSAEIFTCLHMEVISILNYTDKNAIQGPRKAKHHFYELKNSALADDILTTIEDRLGKPLPNEWWDNLNETRSVQEKHGTFYDRMTLPNFTGDYHLSEWKDF